MQQQQHADYDLLAVFTDEEHANAATSKLHKEGFIDEEVYQLEAGTVGSGQFREHGPSQTRGNYFLQTQRTQANLVLVMLFALTPALVLGGLSFAASFVMPNPYKLFIILAGILLGLALGASFAVVRGGRVRGAIGQDLSKSSTAPPRPSQQAARTVVALRSSDEANISRKSRARAILLNNGGKIDSSVGRRE